MRTQPCNCPAGTFRGTNMITPEIIEYRVGNLHARTVYIEISKERPPYFSRTVGRDQDGGPLYGVTFNHADGSKPDPDPSTCFHSMREVTEFLDNL